MGETPKVALNDIEFCSGFWGFQEVLKEFSMPNMTGRPGHRTMEINGGSSAPHLARTPCVPLFCTSFIRGGNRRAFRLPGTGGDTFHCTGTFARSYSVSKFVCDFCLLEVTVR